MVKVNLITDDGIAYMEKMETLTLCCHGNFDKTVNRNNFANEKDDAAKKKNFKWNIKQVRSIKQ